MSKSMMDTVAGGEGDQYEDSIKTVTQPSPKQSGSLGNISNDGSAQLSEDKSQRGNQTAENIRYGQKLSEEGMGGQTTGVSGQSNQDGYGDVQPQEDNTTAAKTRREQGYGPGSGVGA